MFPHLVTATNVPRLTKVGDVDWSNIDAAFCCLPHATTQEILNSLPKHIKVVDLSADFRLKDIKLYAEWYALTFTQGAQVTSAPYHYDLMNLCHGMMAEASFKCNTAMYGQGNSLHKMFGAH